MKNTFSKSFIVFGVILSVVLGYFAYGPSAQSGSMDIENAYARASSPSAKAGAAFFTISNGTGFDDVLIEASTVAARKVELHTHKMDVNGVAMMMPVEGGINVPAGETSELKRGGDHVMMMGLVNGLSQGDAVELTLTFKNAGKITVIVPVDLTK